MNMATSSVYSARMCASQSLTRPARTGTPGTPASARAPVLRTASPHTVQQLRAGYRQIKLSTRSKVSGRKSLSVSPVCAESTTDETTTPTQELGASGVQVSSVGVGAWSWGDTAYWGFDSGYGERDVRAAFDACLSSGLTFIDTAEVYGLGKSEELLGQFIKQNPAGAQTVVATKFAPLPWRFTKESVVCACKESLKRLQLEQVDLYMLHWPALPLPFVSDMINEAFLEGLAECYKQGLCRAVGVSNFNAKRLRAAHAFLKERDVPLASNQVQYSLLYRAPESTGVLEACKELNVTLVAYSPFCQGLLTGKYSADSSTRPSGPRQRVFTDERLREVAPLVDLMRTIGEAHGGKTPSQVALNWLICKGALPIPGVKTQRQVEETAGGYEGGWLLTSEEVAQLDAASQSMKNAPGAPFENW